MLVCKVCGKVYEEEEARKRSYDHEFHYDEVYYLCPHCHSDEFEEATKCKICGEYFYDEDNVGVCEECLDNSHDLETAFEYGAYRMESVAINGAIYALLTEEQINAILTKYVEENFTDNSKEVANYCNEDKQDFAKWLIERNGD